MLNDTACILHYKCVTCITHYSSVFMWYLLIILQLVVKYDPIGLIWLGPGESDAVNGATDLMHDRHRRRSWKKKTVSYYIQYLKNDANQAVDQLTHALYIFTEALKHRSWCVWFKNNHTVLNHIIKVARGISRTGPVSVSAIGYGSSMSFNLA